MCDSVSLYRNLEHIVQKHGSNICLEIYHLAAQSHDPSYLRPIRDSAKAKEGHTTTSWAPTALSPAIQFDVDFWDLPMARRAHGKYLRKPFMSGTLQKLHEGLIKYMGIRSRPYAFKVTYDDGDSETMCLAEVLHYLKPLSAPTV